MHVLRRAALLADDRERDGPGVEAMGTPAALVRTSLGFVDPAARYAAAFVNQSDVQHHNVPDPHPLIEGVINARNHVSTDEMLEFRVEVCPRQFVALAQSGIKGRHKPPGGEEEKILKKPTPEAESTLRMWIPGVMLQRVHAAMVEEYFEGKTKSKGKEKAPLEDESESDPDTAPSSQPKPRGETSRSKGKQRGLDDEQSSANSTPLSSQQKADPLDWRAEVDRMLATAGRKKKRPTTPDIGDRRTKKQRVSAASFAEALRCSLPDEDIIDLTSD
jgi:Holliday junction resolvase YEN1